MEPASGELVSLLEWFPLWVLVMLRFLGVLIAAPLISGRGVPVRYKALLASMLAVGAIGLLPPGQRRPVPLDLWGLAPMMVGEVAIGYALGLAAFLPFLAIELGGYLIGYQMGFSIAQAFNPMLETNLNSIGSMLFYIAVASFMLLGGADHLFGAVLTTFGTIPVGGYWPGASALDLMLALLASATDTGMRLAAPAFGSAMILLIAIGFVMKTMPELNVMSVGFALKIVFGVAMTALSVFVIARVIDGEIVFALRSILDWAEAPGARPIGAQGGGAGAGPEAGPGAGPGGGAGG